MCYITLSFLDCDVTAPVLRSPPPQVSAQTTPKSKRNRQRRPKATLDTTSTSSQDRCETPPSRYETPPSHRGTPLSHCGTPPSHCGTPLFHGGSPPSHRGTPSFHRGTPPSHCGTPTAHHETPSRKPDDFGTPTATMYARTPTQDQKHADGLCIGIIHAFAQFQAALRFV